MVELPKDTNSHNVAQAITPDINQRISFGASSVVSAAFDSDTSLIRLFATKDCWVRLGANGSVTAEVNDGESQFIPAGILIFLGTMISKIYRATHLAVIRDAEDGMLHILEAD